MLNYRRDIDGLRGIAVISVLLFHFGLGPTGGFVGVDVFFVISGYLITAWILKSVDRDTFTFREFWARRIRRILPASVVMSAAVLAAGYLLLLPTDFEDLGSSQIANTFFSSNIYFWRHSGYFDGAAELKPLLHTWSLAIEEQFYVLFPPILWLLLRRGRQWAFGWLLVAMAGSLLACIALTPRMPSATFYLLPTRAWELLTGSIIAFLPTSLALRAVHREALGLIGLLAVLLSLVLFHDAILFPGYWAAIPVLGTAVLIHVNNGSPTLTSRLLSVSPLVSVGLVSYSLYLWHWPILVFAKYLLGNLSWIALTIVACLSFAVAWMSWICVETPIRQRVKTSEKKLFWLAALTHGSLLAGAATIVTLEGVPRRLSSQALEIIDATQFKFQHLATDTSDFSLADLPRLGVEGKQPTFLVWGDSHAMALGEQLDQTARDLGLSGCMAAHGGYAPLLDAWRPSTKTEDPQAYVQWNEQVIELIEQSEFTHVILIAAWQNYLQDGSIAMAGQSHANFDTTLEAMRRQLPLTVRAIEQTGAEVWIVLQPPLQPFDVGRSFRNHAIYSWAPPPMKGIEKSAYLGDARDLRLLFQSVASEKVHVLDPIDTVFDESGQSRLTSSGHVMYVDSNHVSQNGAQVFFSEGILRMLKTF